MDDLMSLEEINSKRSQFSSLGSATMVRLCETARAAHELQAKCDRMLTECASHTGELMLLQAKYNNLQKENSWSYENAAQAAGLTVENDALRAKLAEVSEDRERCCSLLAGYQSNLIAAENELSRLHAAAPGDVEEALEKYEVTISDVSFCRASSHNALCDARDDAKEKLLTLIGALITRSKEARRNEIMDAFTAGSIAAIDRNQKMNQFVYADQILNKNECKCENTTPTSEITRQCQDCGRQWLGRMERE